MSKFELIMVLWAIGDTIIKGTVALFWFILKLEDEDSK